MDRNADEFGRFPGDWRIPFDQEKSKFDETDAHLLGALAAARNQSELLALMLSEAFGRIERLERLARQGRQGVPLGPVRKGALVSQYPQD